MLARTTALLTCATLLACGGSVSTFEDSLATDAGDGKADTARQADAGLPDAGLADAGAPPVADLGPVLARIVATVAAASPATDPAIAVEWLATGARWDHHGDEAHVAASSVKFAWAAAALHAQPVGWVQDDALPTFEASDNSAAGRLIDRAGGADAVNTFTSTVLGVAGTGLWLCSWNYDRPREASTCPSPVSGNNYLTPLGGLAFLRAVWDGAGLSAEAREALLAWSLRSPRSGDDGGWLGNQLPEAVRQSMHHKAGWLPPGSTTSAAAFATMNEIGIVSTPRGAYAVALLFAHGPDYWGAQKRGLEWASCVIYHALAADADDPFAAGCVAP